MKLYEKYKTLFKKYQIDTPLRIAHFMAQIEHESGLKPIAENLNYSYERLLEIFKTDFDVNKNRVLSEEEKSLAKKIAKNPEKIGNFVYANQNGNGGVSSGDGFKFFGRGFIQITGRYNYQMLTNDTKIDFINNPDLLLQEPNAIISALWFWDKKNINRFADKDDIKGVTKAINGGYNGLKDRERLLVKYKKSL